MVFLDMGFGTWKLLISIAKVSVSQFWGRKPIVFNQVLKDICKESFKPLPVGKDSYVQGKCIHLEHLS